MSIALAQASGALLGATASAGQIHAQEIPWQIDSAILHYQESDGRVRVIEPVVALKKDFGDEYIFNTKLVLNSLTGASPNGAAPANVAQTFTATSGGTSYTVAPGELPLDSSFKDVRGALSASWQQPIAPGTRLNVGGNISAELDFLSIAGNAAVAKDFNGKNTTLSAGFNLEYDSISPIGGAPVPFTQTDFRTVGTGAVNKTTDTKTVTDVLFGVTQVLSRQAIMQLNYSLSQASGYQTDPYKILTVLRDDNNLFPIPWYVYEKRPESRTKHNVYSQLKYHLTEDVINLSYRYTTDNWGIASHTFDTRYRFEFGDSGVYIEPHARWYTQTAADFYKPYLMQGVDVIVGGAALIQFATADSRLSAFNATTFGAKLGMALENETEVSLRVEQYKQVNQTINTLTTGDLAGQKLAPDLSALIVQVGLSFRW
ncbi:MAG: DUF3570 domain-containing protein [Candidatus Nitrotoga sp.]